MTLTAKQEAFAQELAKGRSQSDAYRIAYRASPNTKPHSIHSRASIAASKLEVQQRVKELRVELAAKGLWKREDSVRELANIVNTAKQILYKKEGDKVVLNEKVGNADKSRIMGTIISAVDKLNAMHGHNEPTKIDHLSSDGSMSPLRIDPKKLSTKALEEIIKQLDATKN